MIAVAAHDEIARNALFAIVGGKSHAWMVGREIVQSHVINLVEGSGAACGVGVHEIAGDLGLTIDNDSPSAGRGVDVNALKAIPERQVEAVVDEALAAHALADTGSLQKVHRSLLDDARANTSGHVRRGPALKHDAIDPGAVEELRQQESPRPRADDRGLGAQNLSHSGPACPKDCVMQWTSKPVTCTFQSGRPLGRGFGRMPVEYFPVFDLYGESAERPSLDAIHVETLFSRSHKHDWEIRPHRHADLHQVFWLTRGGGIFLCDGAEEQIAARTAILIPRGAVHGFHWKPNSDGYVLTLWAPFLAAFEPIAGRIANAFAECAIAPLAGRAKLSRAMDQTLELLLAEFRQSDVGRTGVMAGLVSQVLAYIQRGLALSRSAHPARDACADLMRRFEARIETRLAQQDPIDVYCRELGVSNSRLVRACRAVLDRSPLEVVNDRILLEAKRLLIYTGLSVSKVGYALGFADPAYFSRFFKLRECVSPQQFRSNATRSGARRSGGGSVS